MARAKHTGRAEARRRYRQTASQQDVDVADELDDAAPSPAAAPTKSAVAAPARSGQARPGQARPAPASSGRPGFLAAFRDAYHPARVREDLARLPKLVTSRALLAGVGITLAAAAAYALYPNYDGSTMAFQLIVIPGAALLPQLVTGFFAPAASYLLGFIVGIVQGVAFLLVIASVGSRTVPPITSAELTAALPQALLFGPLSSGLFAAGAAWYRRFLALSSPRRAQPTKGQGNRAAKASPARRPGR